MARRTEKDEHSHPDGNAPKHQCGTLFGCGDELGVGIVREDAREAIGGRKGMDRLQHMDEVNQDRLDRYLDARGRDRRALLKSGGLLGFLAALSPAISRVARADDTGGSTDDPGPGNDFGHGRDADVDDNGGNVVEIPSNLQTVSWGVFDETLPNIANIDSGDSISYVDTWSHFFNGFQPGVDIDTLVNFRLSHPGRGPHTIIGPVGVNGAQLGDVLEIRYQRLSPFDWGGAFANHGSVGTGLLPQDFPVGEVRYSTLNLDDMTSEFLPGINVPLLPFQGTLGLAPPVGYFPPLMPGVTSSVPPGPHAGNLDLRELGEGSKLYIPVWKDGARIYTGDSHAVQGDGEICLTALETRMHELRIKVILHKNKNFAWPFAETKTHWIAIGLDRDLNKAMTLAARNAIAFLNQRAGLTAIDAYLLLSIASSFRVTQVVDIVRGIHVMIPKSIFSDDLRRQITVV